MKTYSAQIKKVEDKIAELNKIGNKFSAKQIQDKLGRLNKAISFKDEKGAEKAAADLKEFADDVEIPDVDAFVEPTKKKK